METLPAVQTEVIDKKALSAVEQARTLTITTNELFMQADEACVGLKELEKEITSTFEDGPNGEAKQGPVPRAYAAWKACVAARDKHLEPVLEARKIIKGKMTVWADEQERLRREEEERLQKEAQKKADEEALRLAEQAQAEGKTEEAEAIIAAPPQAAPVVVPKATPKVATVIRKVWTWRVVNEALVPRAYLKIDDSKLTNQARSTGASLPVPGVEFFLKSI